MTKVALNPSLVMEYDLIHAIDPDTGAHAFESDLDDLLNEAGKFYLKHAYGIRIAAFTTDGGIYNQMKRMANADLLQNSCSVNEKSAN